MPKRLKIRRQKTPVGRYAYSISVPQDVAERLDSRHRYEATAGPRGEIIFTPVYTVPEPRIYYDREQPPDLRLRANRDARRARRRAQAQGA